MEPIAENRYTLTKALFFEGMLRASAEQYGKLAQKAVAFLAAAWLALAAFTLQRGERAGYVALELFVMLSAALWIAVYVPRRKAKKAFQALERRYGEDMDRVTYCFADRLEVEAAGRRKTVLYAEIEQILHSENLLILIAGDKTGVLMKCDGFISGTAADVLEHIKGGEAT